MWQCYSNMQLSVLDPNQRQKEKNDIQRQQGWQVKLKEVLGLVILMMKKD